MRRAAALLVILLCCAVLYVQGASLWLDEASVALNLRERTLPGLWTEQLSYGQVFPRAWLSCVWLLRAALGTEDPRVLRLLPFLAMVGGVAAWLALGRRVLKDSATPLLLLAALLASPSVLRYAAELKQYAFDVLCVAVGLHAVWALTRDPPRRRLWAVILVLAVGTSHLAWLPCGALWLAIALRGRPDRTAALALGGGGLLLLLTDVLGQLGHTGKMVSYWAPWMVPAWPPDEAMAAFFTGQGAQLLGYSLGPRMLARGGVDPGLGMGLVFGAVLLGVVLQRRTLSPQDARGDWLLAWLLTVAASTAASMTGLLPLGQRVTLGLFPMLLMGPLILLDRRLESLAPARRIWLRRALGALATIYLVVCVGTVARRGVREDLHPRLPHLVGLDWLVVDHCSTRQWALLTRPAPPGLQVHVMGTPTEAPPQLDQARTRGGYVVTHQAGQCAPHQEQVRQQLGGAGRVELTYTGLDAALWTVSIPP